MKKLLLVLLVLIACRQDKGKNESGAYNLTYTCLGGHYEESSILVPMSGILMPVSSTNFVCDSERVDTSYITRFKH